VAFQTLSMIASGKPARTIVRKFLSMVVLRKRGGGGAVYAAPRGC
jgi:hypothetical protein